MIDKRWAGFPARPAGTNAADSRFSSDWIGTNLGRTSILWDRAHEGLFDPRQNRRVIQVTIDRNARRNRPRQADFAEMRSSEFFRGIGHRQFVVHTCPPYI